MNAKLPPQGPPYDVDDETRSFLESVLTISAGVADLQHDDECRNDIYTLLDEVADRFLIEKHHIEFDADDAPIVGDHIKRIPLYGVQEFRSTEPPNLHVVRSQDDGSSNIIDINSFNNKASKSQEEPEGPSG